MPAIIMSLCHEEFPLIPPAARGKGAHSDTSEPWTCLYVTSLMLQAEWLTSHGCSNYSAWLWMVLLWLNEVWGGKMKSVKH